MEIHRGVLASMSYRCWLRIVALGLIVCGAGILPASGQNDQVEPPKASPIVERENAADIPATPEKPALAAIREGLDHSFWKSPKCSESASHDEADLCQQIRMANAAESTLLIAWWQFGLGVLGGALLFANLYYARRAANGAIAAAEAAQAAVTVAREMGEAQVRAYVRIVSGTVELVSGSFGMVDQRLRPLVSIKVRNYGQSPTLRFQWSIIVRYYPPMDSPFLGNLCLGSDSWGKDIGPGEELSLSLNLGSALLDSSAMQILATEEFHMDFVIRYAFHDVFGNRVEDERIFTAFVPPNGVGIKASLIPHVFDKQMIDRLIEANKPETLARWESEKGREE